MNTFSLGSKRDVKYDRILLAAIGGSVALHWGMMELPLRLSVMENVRQDFMLEFGDTYKEVRNVPGDGSRFVPAPAAHAQLEPRVSEGIDIREKAEYLKQHPEAFQKSLEEAVRSLSETSYHPSRRGDIVISKDLRERLIGEYKNSCAGKIGENVWYPDMAHLTGKQGQVVVALTVNEDGSLQNSSVFLSSEHLELDMAALDAVVKSAPFRAFPPELTLKALSFFTTITYDLERIPKTP